MSDAVQQHFNASAEKYDTIRRLLIPNFDEFYRIGVDSLVCAKISPRVLDLGGGTGLSTAFLLQRYPQARVTLLDFSDEMLAVARERFSENPNINFVQSDYRSFAFEESFDIVISGLSIHHLSFEEKQALTTKIQGILVASGEFVNADIVKGQNNHLEQEMQRRLGQFLQEGLTEEQLKRYYDRLYLDIPITLNEHLSIMEQAGFGLVDCLYRFWNYGVFYGQKDPADVD
ncbi:MAG: methyltransferase domain-containing protein [Coriobacteriales bacterium]|jgi:tRNA (cmo5U34)-methyltransferase|nr:methyltransferase domain-containing protein [Coriobacteriales bacterium]